MENDRARVCSVENDEAIDNVVNDWRCRKIGDKIRIDVRKHGRDYFGIIGDLGKYARDKKYVNDVWEIIWEKFKKASYKLRMERWWAGIV